MLAQTPLEDPVALGEAIRARRKAVGLRQIDLATSANTSLRFVSEVERGKKTAQIGAVMRLLNALGLELRLQGR